MFGNSLGFRRDLVIIPSKATPADRSYEKRRIRKHAILNVVRQQGPISRADISKATGFNVRTCSLLVDELVEDRLLLEHSAVENHIGRPPTLLTLDARAAIVMGIDIGRQRTIGRLMDLTGGLIKEAELATPPIREPEGFAHWANDVARQTLSGTGPNLPPLCGIGVGIPPLIQRGEENALFDKQNVVALIRTQLGRELDVEILVDTDARMMAMGSLWFGLGRQYKNYALLKMGVGLGLGVVLGGSLLKGAFGCDLEFGHVPMGDSNVPCYCGARGCLESVVSGTGIERMAREMGLEIEGAAQAAEMARNHDPRALQVFSQFAQGLGRAIAIVINLFNPEAVILSGRVTRAADIFFDEARRCAASHALKPLYKNAKLIVSDPNARLGALGAISIVYSHIFHSHHVAVDEVL